MASLRQKWPLRRFAPEALMALSVALLLVLQFLWLQVSFQDARENFRAETNDLFRTTLLAMHDSLVLRNIEPVSGDTMMRLRSLPPFRGGVKTGLDSSRNGTPHREMSAYVEIFLSPGTGDSLQHILRPLVRRIRTDGRHRKFFVRMAPDSLHTDSIHHQYNKALLRVGLDIPFSVHHVRSRYPGEPPVANVTADALRPEFVTLTPLHHYAVSFRNVDRYLLGRIAPQVLFAVFVTLLTLGAFLLMMRNIRTQRNLVMLKNDLISNISHELKTPVATVSVALEAMERFRALDDRHKTRAYLDMAQAGLRRLALITEKILQEASFESRAAKATRDAFDMDKGVREVLRSMQPVLERAQVKTGYRSVGSNFIIYGNPAHLMTVLFNLVDNAVKYRREPAEIFIRLEERDQTIDLYIKDNGVGIPREFQERIFEKFFRVPSGDTHNTHGHGLGLSYVSRVVADHHGKIRVDSEPGKGSTFTLSFPKNEARI